MQRQSNPSADRLLRDEERTLLRWMLEHGGEEAQPYLATIDEVRVTDYRCPCGCASVNFRVPGRDGPSGGIYPVADFLIHDGDQIHGTFVYVQSGQLGGIEVYGCSGDAPKRLPLPEQLKPLSGPAAG